MILVDNLCHLGNLMFQYSFARILAEKMNYKMILRPADELSQKHFEEKLMNNFINAIPIEGRVIQDFIFITNDNFRYDMNNILKYSGIKGIHLHGWFQRKHYYIDYLEKIKEWFWLAESQNDYKITEKDIVLHVRRGDFRGTIHSIKMSFYQNILDNLSFDRVFICGDEFDEEVVQSLTKYNPIYFHISTIEDLRFIKSFNRIIMSNSTYAWWAAMLSNAKEIYCPNTKNYKAFFNDDQDLIMPNFIVIANVETGN